MSKIRSVKRDISVLRRQLEELVSQRGVSDPETIRCSQLLDRAIMAYYGARKPERSTAHSCVAD